MSAVELNEFVRQTITQVLEGVTNAQSDAVEINAAFINPPLTGFSGSAAEYGLLKALDGVATEMQFDVVLTAEEGKSTKAEIGVVAGLASLGSTGESSAYSASVIKVKFNVPVQLPIQNTCTKNAATK